MTSHLLPLSTISATLPVLFGPDGDFPGAPRWKCLVWGSPVYMSPLTARWIDSDNVNMRDGSVRVWEQWAPMDGEWLTVPDAALDLRIPTIAARVAGLCARTLGYTQPATWGVTVSLDAWSLRGIPVSPRSMWEQAPEFAWERFAGRPMGYAGADHPAIPALADAADAASGLASLYIALAPRIAALGCSHD